MSSNHAAAYELGKNPSRAILQQTRYKYAQFRNVDEEKVIIVAYEQNSSLVQKIVANEGP